MRRRAKYYLNLFASFIISTEGRFCFYLCFTDFDEIFGGVSYLHYCNGMSVLCFHSRNAF